MTVSNNADQERAADLPRFRSTPGCQTIAAGAESPSATPVEPSMSAAMHEARYHRLVEGLPEAVLVQTGGEIRYVNPAAVRILGADSGRQVIGRQLTDFIFADYHKLTWWHLLNHDAVSVGPSFSERTLKRMDGAVIDIEMAACEILFDSRVSDLVVLRDISDRKRMETDLIETKRGLEEEHQLMKDKNLALREVLNQIDDEKRHLVRQIQANVDKVVIPILRSLEANATSIERKYLRLIGDQLEDISSQFAEKLSVRFVQLSPRELQVCNLIRNGLSCKDIARTLDTSVHTILKQRQSIRRKLGIGNQPVNLATFLQTV